MPDIKQRLNVLLVDDEVQSRLLIWKLLDSHDTTFTVTEADSVSSALQAIKDHRQDLILLDVQLRSETGFDLLDQVGDINVPVIFITAHSEHAVRAFRYGAFDYLLKPIDFTEFASVLGKVTQRLSLPQQSEARFALLREDLQSMAGLPQKLTIPTIEGFLILDPDEILYCAAASNYTEFFLAGKQKVISSYTLGHYEETLADRQFFRVHRSYLINRKHVRMYKKGDGGTVVMTDGKEIEVSRSNKEAFLKLFYR